MEGVRGNRWKKEETETNEDEHVDNYRGRRDGWVGEGKNAIY